LVLGFWKIWILLESKQYSFQINSILGEIKEQHVSLKMQYMLLHIVWIYHIVLELSEFPVSVTWILVWGFNFAYGGCTWRSSGAAVPWCEILGSTFCSHYICGQSHMALQFTWNRLEMLPLESSLPTFSGTKCWHP